MTAFDKLHDIIISNGLLKKYNIDKVGVFGSTLHSDHPNDIDLYIEKFSDYKDLLGLKKEIELKTGKTVDIVIEKFASPIIVYRARKELKYVA